MKRNSKYTKEVLEPIVEKCHSITGVLRELSLNITGGNHRHISGIIRHHAIDTSHFTGQLWSKGKTKETNSSIASTANKIRKPNEEFFIENAYPTSGTKIAKRLKEIKVEYKCSICGINTWLGNPLTLHVDHINGNHTDNRLENLRFLCPNCHQQTDTWGNKVKP